MRLETLDSRVTSGSDTDPFYLDVEEVFDVPDVFLTVFGQRLECRAFRNIRLPTGESDVFHLDLGEEVEIGYEDVVRVQFSYHDHFIDLLSEKLTWESLNLLSIKLVLGSDLDLLEPVKHIELGQVQRGVSVDHRRVLHDHQIEPSGSTSSTSRYSPFSTNFLELNTDVL
jgi:hypothetical protein